MLNDKQIFEKICKGVVDVSYLVSDVGVMVKNLAKKQFSTDLTQLTLHIAAVVKYGAPAEKRTKLILWTKLTLRSISVACRRY